MDEEQKMVRDIRGLDSDMQTLVYENYNKFISATDTIRKVSMNYKYWVYELCCLCGGWGGFDYFQKEYKGLFWSVMIQWLLGKEAEVFLLRILLSIESENGLSSKPSS